MKRNSIFILGVFVASLLSMNFAYGQNNEDKSAYIKTEQEKRAKKDVTFKTGHHSNKSPHNHSPLSKEQKEKFEKLAYYDVDPKWNVKVEYKKLKNQVPFQMTFNDGNSLMYVKHGILSFEIDGKSYSLSAYQDSKFVEHHDKDFKGYLFIPFKDATNGDETFGGGRYIQWHVPEGKGDMIDFNNAFNPFCVYNPKTKCPIPPEENHLDVKIAAGEKDFEL